jgi:hypothetical protein
MNEPGTQNYEVGYARPPASTRYQKGRSGNPRGRPRGSKKRPPYEAVLGQIVVVREEGAERRMSAAEAFLLHIAKRGLEGDSAAARAAMAAIEQARSRRSAVHGEGLTIVHQCVAPGSVNCAMRPLRMATKLDPYRETSRMALEPWLVEAAIARLGEHRLGVSEQRTIVAATRMPHKVRWPSWWQVR